MSSAGNPPAAPRPPVFISYASDDRAAARVLRDAINQAGLEAWYDESELGGGDAWDQKIRRQTRDCDYFMPVISATTERRKEGYFRREWRLATERTLDMADDVLFLLPVVLDETHESGARVPERFLSVQWLRTPAGQRTPALDALLQRLLAGEHPVVSRPPLVARPPQYSQPGAREAIHASPPAAVSAPNAPSVTSEPKGSIPPPLRGEPTLLLHLLIGITMPLIERARGEHKRLRLAGQPVQVTEHHGGSIASLEEIGPAATAHDQLFRSEFRIDGRQLARSLGRTRSDPHRQERRQLNNNDDSSSNMAAQNHGGRFAHRGIREHGGSGATRHPELCELRTSATIVRPTIHTVQRGAGKPAPSFFSRFPIMPVPTTIFQPSGVNFTFTFSSRSNCGARKVTTARSGCSNCCPVICSAGKSSNAPETQSIASFSGVHGARAFSGRRFNHTSACARVAGGTVNNRDSAASSPFSAARTMV